MRSYRISVIALLATGIFHLAPGLASARVDDTPSPSADLMHHALDPCATNADCTNPDEPICNVDDVCAPCTLDSECGDEDSGIVCNPIGGHCLMGCRGTGNGCPAGSTCTSIDDTIGKCDPGDDSSSDSEVSVTSSAEESDASAGSDTADDCGSTAGDTEVASTGDKDDTAGDTKPAVEDADVDCKCTAGGRGAGGPLLLLGIVGAAVRRRRG